MVAHCHNMGVIHRDVHLGNFLLADAGQEQVGGGQMAIKAVDFGKSYFFTVRAALCAVLLC